ncbi:MAG: hypothetical protein ACMXYD_04660 [Candidatus Woesearchaeota archaeon]
MTIQLKTTNNTLDFSIIQEKTPLRLLEQRKTLSEQEKEPYLQERNPPEAIPESIHLTPKQFKQHYKRTTEPINHYTDEHGVRITMPITKQQYANALAQEADVILTGMPEELNNNHLAENLYLANTLGMHRNDVQTLKYLSKAFIDVNKPIYHLGRVRTPQEARNRDQKLLEILSTHPQTRFAVTADLIYVPNHFYKQEPL